MDLVFNERIKDTFHFKKSGNFFSFGNVISVKMKSVDEGKQKISVISSSSTTIQLLDWGTNGNLEVEFIEMLNDLTQK